jgi:hypothetical protein
MNRFGRLEQANHRLAKMPMKFAAAYSFKSSRNNFQPEAAEASAFNMAEA